MTKPAVAVVLDVARRRYWREADARIVVEAWRDSGERLSAFAERFGITTQRLARWSTWLATRPRQSMRFHRVEVIHPPTGARLAETPAPPIEVVLRDGHAVRVPRGFAPEDLQRVLEVLREARA